MWFLSSCANLRISSIIRVNALNNKDICDPSVCGSNASNTTNHYSDAAIKPVVGQFGIHLKFEAFMKCMEGFETYNTQDTLDQLFRHYQ